MSEVQKGDIYDIDLQYITKEGMGVYVNPRYFLFLVKKISEKDEAVRVEVDDVIDNICYAHKVAGGSLSQREESTEEEVDAAEPDGPYEVDDGSEES